MEKIPQQTDFAGLRIVLYGPESTGKSTLSRKLASHFNTVQVAEFARNYLQEKYDQSGIACEYHDLMPIAIGQRTKENRAAKNASQYLFCDTDLLETYVYSHAYFGKAPLELTKAVRESHYDLYLLMDVDTPWEQDDLRDKPDDRQEMFEQFEQALQNFGKNYVVINGQGKKRFDNALHQIKKRL